MVRLTLGNTVAAVKQEAIAVVATVVTGFGVESMVSQYSMADNMVLADRPVANQGLLWIAVVFDAMTFLALCTAVYHLWKLHIKNVTMSRAILLACIVAMCISGQEALRTTSTSIVARTTGTSMYAHFMLLYMAIALLAALRYRKVHRDDQRAAAR